MAVNLSQFIGPSGQAGYLGTNAMQRALDSGLSISDIRKLALQQGLSLGSEAGLIYPKLNNALAINDKSKPSGNSIGQANSAKQALRIAGSDGNISKKELKKIGNKFDIDNNKIVKNLDTLNTGLKDRGKDLQIGLGTGAVNSILKNTPTGLASLNQAAAAWGVDNKFGFGSGKIGSKVSNYVNASFTPTGLMGRDQRSIAQSNAGLIPLQGPAYQIDARGNYSPKVSNKAFGNPVPRFNQTSQPEATTPGNTAAPTAMPTPEMPVEEIQMDPGPGMMSGGGAGAAGATKLGRAKSRLRKLGIYGRGTGLLGRGLQYGNALNV